MAGRSAAGDDIRSRARQGPSLTLFNTDALNTDLPIPNCQLPINVSDRAGPDSDNYEGHEDRGHGHKEQKVMNAAAAQGRI